MLWNKRWQLRLLTGILAALFLLSGCSAAEEAEIEEGNRGMLEIIESGDVVYRAALNDSGNPVNDTDRENCAAIYDYGSFILVGDHNYQGFDVLEEVEEGDELVVIPPTENARNLAAPPGTPSQMPQSSSAVISPVSGNPIDTGEEPEEETFEESREPGRYQFCARLMGERKYGTLFGEDGRELRTIATETEAAYITYTCRGNSDTDVWIVVWK